MVHSLRRIAAAALLAALATAPVARVLCGWQCDGDRNGPTPVAHGAPHCAQQATEAAIESPAIVPAGNCSVCFTADAARGATLRTSLTMLPSPEAPPSVLVLPAGPTRALELATAVRALTAASPPTQYPLRI